MSHSLIRSLAIREACKLLNADPSIIHRHAARGLYGEIIEAPRGDKKPTGETVTFISIAALELVHGRVFSEKSIEDCLIYSPARCAILRELGVPIEIIPRRVKAKWPGASNG